MCQTTSKHVEANFKNLLGLKLVPDVVFLVLSSENNDWTIYVFATSVGCKIRSVGSTEFKNVPYLSSRPTCIINVSVKETSMLRLKIWMLSFLEERWFSEVVPVGWYIDFISRSYGWHVKATFTPLDYTYLLTWY